MTLRDHMARRRYAHMRTIIVVGISVLFLLTAAFSVIFHMDPFAIGGLFVIFLSVGYGMWVLVRHD